MLIPHEFFHTFHIAGVTDLDQVLRNPAGSVTTFVLADDLANQWSQLRILDFSVRGNPRPPGVVRRAADLQNLAYRDDRPHPCREITSMAA